jgi:hypothetical protein
MTHNQMTTQTTGNDGNRLILICAPSHDDLTEYTSKLVEDFPDFGAPVVLRKIEGPLTYAQLLRELSPDQRAKDITLVFCGHGEASALLVPKYPPGASGYTDTLASFYDESYIHLGPKIMLAFCCSAAAGLGASYERKTSGSSFVGFKDDILILMEDGNYADCWRALINGLASALMSVPDRSTLERSVRKIYREALAAFPAEKDDMYDWGLMMRGALLQQLADLKVILT